VPGATVVDNPLSIAVLVLSGAITPIHPRRAQVQVFGVSATDPLAPKPETAGLQALLHQANHRFFRQAKLVFNRLKRRSVFPGHLDNAGSLIRAESHPLSPCKNRRPVYTKHLRERIMPAELR